MRCWFTPPSLLPLRLSGVEALPQVSQHRRQPGCRDGDRDGECVKVNIVHKHGVQVLLMSVCVFFQVGQAKDSSLTNLLIDYLMGESDGMPKVINTRWNTAACDLLSTMRLSWYIHCFNSFLMYSSLTLALSFSSSGVRSVSQWVALL